MTTKQQYIAQAKADNPKPMYATINGEQVQLSDDEYDQAITAWAEMRVEQDASQTTPMPSTGGPYKWSEEDQEWVAI